MIVGIGSPHGDDQIGWLAAESLMQYRSEVDAVIKIAKTPSDLLDWLESDDPKPGRLVICDATSGAGRIGEIRVWQWPCSDLEDLAMSGTHNLSLYSILKLADQLDRLPAEVVIWTIEGRLSQANSEMSPRVVEAVRQITDNIMGWLAMPAPTASDQVGFRTRDRVGRCDHA